MTDALCIGFAPGFGMFSNAVTLALKCAVSASWHGHVIVHRPAYSVCCRLMLFAFFRRWLSRRTPPAEAAKPGAAQAQFEKLNRLAPLKPPPAVILASEHALAAATVMGTVSAVTTFVRREPILNRHEQIAGYTFSLSERLQLRLAGEKDLLHKVYDDALLRNLSTLGVHSLLGHRLAFIRLSPVSIDNPLIDQLPAENTVLTLTPARQMLDAPALSAQLQIHAERGLQHGWLLSRNQLAAHPPLLELAAQGDFVHFQTSDFDGLEIKDLMRKLATLRPSTQPPLRSIAHALNSFDEFNLCYRGGFDYFLGDFVSSRENWHPPKSEINRLQIIKLLNLLRGDEDLQVIADQLKLDPVISFKLLRYLNAPVMGLQTPVATLDKALLILGRDRFYRWLSLLLFDIRNPGHRERLLCEQALARAFFLEALSGQGKLPASADEFFILGLFSMLDLLLGQPLDAILAQTRLPSRVQEALLGQAGIYRQALELAMAIEGQRTDALDQQAQACGLEPLQITRHSLGALTQAHQLLSLNHG